MQSTDQILLRIFKLLSCLLITKVIVGVVLNYRDYLPPDFESDFLVGRESHFYGIYQWAFYAHVSSGPCSLLLGMVLVSDGFRRRFSGWHRRLGKLQTVNVVLFVTPSGLWMSLYADSGIAAGAGFAVLGIATAFSAVLGWQLAVRRQFNSHRRWMWRCFVLLCSAVVLRLIGGLTSAAGIESAWVYPLSAWLSWLMPLLACELIIRKSDARLKSVRPENAQ